MSRVHQRSIYRDPAGTRPWSGREWAATVFFMPGTDGHRLAYKRRLGFTLAKLRIARGLTQEGFADTMGTNKDTISRWENGKTEPRAYDLMQLRDKLQVPGDWLLNPTDSITEMEARLAELRRRAGEKEAGDWRARASSDGPDAGPGRRIA